MVDETKTISRKSILPKELKGVVFVTGLRGLGKTLFAVSTDRPENIAFLDFESKGEYFHEQLGFGLYMDVPAQTAKLVGKGKDFDGKDVWKVVKKTIDDLPDGRFTTVVIDTVGDFEAALAETIRYEPQKYGVKPSQVSGGFGGIYPALGVQIENLLSRLHSKGVKLVVVTAHTKPVWAASGPVPNKLKPHGNSMWHDRSILELALIPGEGSVPAGLVQKEMLAGLKFDKETGNLVPYRRVPLRLPQATWAAIKNYLQNPADMKNPAPGETPTDEERGPYSDFFSKEQMEYLLKAKAPLVEATDA